MTTQEVANRLIELCNTGQFRQAHSELYADNCCSIEPSGAPVERVDGMTAIQAKGEQWASMVEEMHHAEISAPMIAGNQFVVKHSIDATYKGQGRSKMEELSVYEVKDGKIVKEQFFYDM